MELVHTFLWLLAYAQISTIAALGDLKTRPSLQKEPHSQAQAQATTNLLVAL